MSTSIFEQDSADRPHLIAGVDCRARIGQLSTTASDAISQLWRLTDEVLGFGEYASRLDLDTRRGQADLDTAVTELSKQAAELRAAWQKKASE